jgi:hypothetical protein
MDTPTQNAFIVTSIYSDEALAAARTGPLDAISTNFCIIRFWLALQEGDLAVASACHTRLLSEDVRGWPLFQVTTGGVFLALQHGQADKIIAALDTWLTGMATYPGNWQAGLLQAPEVVPWLGHFEPQRLVLPRPQKRRLTVKQRAFVKDVAGLAQRAVADNFEWLGDYGSAETLAPMFKLADVNMELSECTLDAKGDVPSLIVSLDAHGAYSSSFIAH